MRENHERLESSIKETNGAVVPVMSAALLLCVVCAKDCMFAIERSRSEEHSSFETRDLNSEQQKMFKPVGKFHGDMKIVVGKDESKGFMTKPSTSSTVNFFKEKSKIIEDQKKLDQEFESLFDDPKL